MTGKNHCAAPCVKASIGIALQQKSGDSRSNEKPRKGADVWSKQNGSEETRRHQLHCRFVLEDNRRQFAKGRAIAWNIRVLNRFECANRLNIPIPSYGGMARVECA